MDIRAFFSHITMDRTRDTAAANETRDIASIVRAINSRSPAGCRIINEFKSTFGIDITAARHRRGSSRGTHYDFEVEVNGEWKRVEHKGGQVYRKPSPSDVPWKAGVQFHNGGCDKYSIARKYAHVWYVQWIASGVLSEEFKVTSPIPSFEEWFSKDCRVQNDPRSAYGKELKRNVRDARGPRSSLLEKRAEVLSALEITEEDKATFIREVLPIANHALLQKDFWLSIHGDLESEFHVRWYPQFTIQSIESVTVQKGLDLNFTFMCADGFSFNPILRWGKGAGFSCLRIDLK